MQRELERLQNQLEAILKKYELTQARLAARKTTLRFEAEKYNDQIIIQERAVEIEKDIFERLSALQSEKAASGMEVSSAESRYLSAQQNLNTLKTTYKKFRFVWIVEKNGLV